MPYASGGSKEEPMVMPKPNAMPEPDNILLRTALFKQVSQQQAARLLPYLQRAGEP